MLSKSTNSKFDKRHLQPETSLTKDDKKPVPIKVNFYPMPGNPFPITIEILGCGNTETGKVSPVLGVLGSERPNRVIGNPII